MNLHIALVMDCTNSKFILNCESNPALYKECAVQWMEGWSRDSMIKVGCLLFEHSFPRLKYAHSSNHTRTLTVCTHAVAIVSLTFNVLPKI